MSSLQLSLIIQNKIFHSIKLWLKYMCALIRDRTYLGVKNKGSGEAYLRSFNPSPCQMFWSFQHTMFPSYQHTMLACYMHKACYNSKTLSNSPMCSNFTKSLKTAFHNGWGSKTKMYSKILGGRRHKFRGSQVAHQLCKPFVIWYSNYHAE
jgi:hypothetical protein